MAYLGNAVTQLIYAANHRDDITPDGVSSSFSLSQQVPGGYEENVTVFRRRYLKDILVENSNQLSINGSLSQLSCSNASIAAALSIVQPPITGVQPADNIILSGCTNSGNNSVFPILANGVVYNGSTITISLDGALITESGGSITVTRGYLGFWEVLNPGIEYTIGGAINTANYNKIITLSEVPQIDDELYVIHRADATYNFVPTAKSVGPDQLQDNLRNFNCDRFTGNGSTVTYTLSEDAVSSKALMVTVNGVQSDGDDTDASFVGDWQLNNDNISITFHSAPANLAKIRVLNLGFSTISRRATLSPGQVGSIAPHSITSLQLASNCVLAANLNPSSVTNNALGPNSVSGSKILLNNNEGLNWLQLDNSTVQPVLQLTNSNNTYLYSPGYIRLYGIGSINLALGGGDVLVLQSNQLSPSVPNVIDLGATSHEFKDLHLTGQVNANTLNTISDASVGGNLSVTGTINSVNISNLNTQVQQLLPAGSIVMTGASSAPTGWLLCDAGVYAQATYPALYTAIGSTYNIGGEGAGNFRVPDFRQRFALGKASSGTGSTLGQVGGAIDHTHTSAAHTHDLSNHFHNLPAHYHGMGSGADLNIISSGTHNTNIDISHGHTAGSGTNTTSTSSTGLHGGISGNVKTDFVTTTMTDPSHAHTVGDTGHAHGVNDSGHAHGILGRDSGSTASTARFNHSVSSSSASDNTILSNGSTTGISIQSSTTGVTVQSHTTGITLSSSDQLNLDPAQGPAASVQHRHTINMTDPGHFHPVFVDALGSTIKTDTSGVHLHSSGSFSGSIGNVSSGNDGNSTILSGTPSTNSTGSGGAAATTSNNPPFLVVNYIIKT